LRWRDALACYRAAEAEVRGYEARCRGKGYEEQEALQAGYDARCEAMEGALRLLLAAPAPDVAALGVKLALIGEHEAASLEGGEACLAAVERDAIRLCARPAAPARG
jgi:hypothetical protein